jgi:hypothetical protein
MKGPSGRQQVRRQMSDRNRGTRTQAPAGGVPTLHIRSRAMLNSDIFAHNPEVAGSNPAPATK